MRTVTHSSTVNVQQSVIFKQKMKDYLIKPIKAGFVGFATILMVLFFINLLSFVFGSTEHFGMDILDMLLAGVGFLLQLTSTLLKSLVR